MVGWGGVEATGGLSEAYPDTLALKARKRCTSCVEQTIEWLDQGRVEGIDAFGCPAILVGI